MEHAPASSSLVVYGADLVAAEGVLQRVRGDVDKALVLKLRGDADQGLLLKLRGDVDSTLRGLAWDSRFFVLQGPFLCCFDATAAPKPGTAAKWSKPVANVSDVVLIDSTVFTFAVPDRSFVVKSATAADAARWVRMLEAHSAMRRRERHHPPARLSGLSIGSGVVASPTAPAAAHLLVPSPRRHGSFSAATSAVVAAAAAAQRRLDSPVAVAASGHPRSPLIEAGFFPTAPAVSGELPYPVTSAAAASRGASSSPRQRGAAAGLPARPFDVTEPLPMPAPLPSPTASSMSGLRTVAVAPRPPSAASVSAVNVADVADTATTPGRRPAGIRGLGALSRASSESGAGGERGAGGGADASLASIGTVGSGSGPSISRRFSLLHEDQQAQLLLQAPAGGGARLPARSRDPGNAGSSREGAAPGVQSASLAGSLRSPGGSGGSGSGASMRYCHKEDE